MSITKVLGLGSTVILISGCQSWQLQDIEDLPPTAALPETSEPGVVEIRYYDNLDGVEIDTMTSATKFPDNPDEVDTLTSLEAPENRVDNYGTYVRGFIKPPASGEYRFFVSGNDKVEFWLSTSSSPDDADILATVPGWTYINQFTKYSSQTSPYITMDASQRYYFEVLHKEGAGSDHFAVAWEGPGISQQIIGSGYIHSYAQPSETAGLSEREAYSLGYRVGYLDGDQGIAFNSEYPPLDEDQDGLYDKWETVYGLNPTNPADATSDPDDDLLSAADEFLLGTAENNADTDGDGIPDGAEYAYGMDPLDPGDASGDMDNDSYTNLEEYRAGTSPADAGDVPEPSEQGPVYVEGFVGQYYSGIAFDDFVDARVDRSVDFNWGTGQPHSQLSDDNFSVRWNGIFTAPHDSGTNTYRFTVRTNDGVRLYANGTLVIDDWTEHAPTEFQYERTLSPGEEVLLSMEYFERVGSAVAEYRATNTNTGGTLSTPATVKAPDPTTSHSLDSDNDGIPDTWELSQGLSPWVDDADSVSNNAGISNIEAYNSGLDPFTLEEVGTVNTSPGPTEPSPEPAEPNGSITLSWTAPGTRLDGSSLSLSEIDYYRIRYGQSPGALTQTQQVDGAETSFTFGDLASGVWYFSISVVDQGGLASAPSEVVSQQVE